MAVSRVVILAAASKDIVTACRFRRSLDRSLILIVVTRNKAQLQNTRVHARVYASVFLAGYVHGAPCLEYFAHPCARRHTNELETPRKGGARTKGGREWISMSTIWFEFSPIVLFLFAISFAIQEFFYRNRELSPAAFRDSSSEKRSCARRYSPSLHYGCVIITYSFSMGT